MPQSPTVLSRNPLSTIPMQSAYPSRTLIETPCVDVCEVDEATGLCIGCRRSLAEIAAWGAMSAEERRRIMGALSGRQVAAAGKVGVE